MHKEAQVNARMEPKLKSDAESILHELGLSAPEAIRIFYRQICLRKGLPFEVKIPNKKTLDAIREAESSKAKIFDNIQDALKDLKS